MLQHTCSNQKDVKGLVFSFHLYLGLGDGIHFAGLVHLHTDPPALIVRGRGCV